ncbi:PREDICTED: uncharacterized protein LOC108689136 [Atta colombica]|uniref:uncharacterized protein LOC108689136 n=1 Tax=Atta colombica TaxID=520822 RepID=UPI00084C4B07|nr:PREDICTED: uncharacterized protein LOC108689136 [Atta colombica]
MLDCVSNELYSWFLFKDKTRQAWNIDFHDFVHSESLQTRTKMFAINNGLRNTLRLSGVITRTVSNRIICTPPQVKISTAEEIFAYLCIVGSLLISPMYMVPNFKNYGKRS